MTKRLSMRWAVAIAAGAVLATAAIVAPGVVSQAKPDSASPAELKGFDRLKWGPCAAPPGQPLPPALQCATISVPLDYGKTFGSRISIAVSRLKTSKPGVRRGVILANAGEPGRPGLYLPLQLSGELSPAVLDRYDLIGFDPRGVGQSSPVSCGLRHELLNVSDIYPYPEGDGDIAANIAYSKEVARACAKNEPRMLRHLTTKNIARDMDRIRAALREPKISYLGFSSGSYLGSTFGELFPHRTDRIVLDSGGHPNRMWRGIFQNWAPATKVRFPDFTTWLASQDATYHLGRNPAELEKLYLKLAADLDTRPVRLPARPLFSGVLDGNTFREVNRQGLSGDGYFPALAALWQGVRDRLPAPRLTERIAPFFPDGFPIEQVERTVSALYVMGCADAPWPRSVPQYIAEVKASRSAHPVTAGMPKNIVSCAFWPFTPTDKPVNITGRGAKNVLMLNNTHDPASPYEGALALRKAFGDRARLVTVDGGGHGTLFHFMSRATPNACADRFVEDFLVHGRRPASDRTCTPDTGKR